MRNWNSNIFSEPQNSGSFLQLEGEQMITDLRLKYDSLQYYENWNSNIFFGIGRFTVPMRNWNTPGGKPLATYFLVFLQYLWGIETPRGKLRPRSKFRVFTVPMRNWNWDKKG